MHAHSARSNCLQLRQTPAICCCHVDACVIVMAAPLQRSTRLVVVLLQWWTTVGLVPDIKQATYALCGGWQIYQQKYEHTINTLAKEAVRPYPSVTLTCSLLLLAALTRTCSSSRRCCLRRTFSV